MEKLRSNYISETQYGFDKTSGRQKGLTLVELLVSIAVTMVLMLAIGSTMLIATHAFPDVNGPANAIIVASEAAEQLAIELKYAVTFTERTANAVEFTVADRNADEAPESIRYEWSGTASDPLTRQYNGGTAVALLDAVQDFNLSYDIETITEETIIENESTETLLADYNSLDVFGNPEIQQGLWAAQYIMPSLPGNPNSWKVTKVTFKTCRVGKDDGEVSVELQLPTAENVPDGVVLESWTLLESTLTGDLETQEFAVSNVSGLSPDQGICLVFRYVAGDASACMLQGQDQNNKPENGNLVESIDQGASWSSYTNRTLLYELYGTVKTVSTQIQETHYLRTVQIKLRTGNDEQSAVYTGTNVLNKPAVTP